MEKIIRNVTLTLVVGLLCLIYSTIISFLISLMLPGDPVLAYLPPGPIDATIYNQVRQQLGLDLPLIFRFFRYAFDMFSGNWGLSLSLMRGMPIYSMMMQKIPRTIDLLLLPLIIGLFLGLLLAKFSIKTRSVFANRIIQILSLLGFAFPIILLAMVFQFSLGYIFPIFPTVGFKSSAYPNPPYVTGFRVIDSLYSGEFYLIPDYLHHLVLPWIVLTISFTTFTALLGRLYLTNRSKNEKDSESIAPFIFQAGFGIGTMVAFLMLTDIMFRFSGLGEIILLAIRNSDYYAINASIFLILEMFSFFIVIIPLLFILIKEIKTLYILRHPKINQLDDKEIAEDDNKTVIPEAELKRSNLTEKTKIELKDFFSYLFLKLKSPFTILGLGIITFAVIVSFAPQILTPYSFDEAVGVYSGAWGPPSMDHPLGQAKFGRDVLARLIYSLPNSLIVGIISVLIGLAGGLIIGIPLILLKRKFKAPIELVLIPIYAIPMIISFVNGLIMYNITPTILQSFGIYMMPFFVYIISRARPSFYDVSKRVLPYIPLLIGLAIMVYNLIAFLGFSDHSLIQFGADMEEAREYLYIAPWAFFFPGLALFVLIFGFFILYGGLQKNFKEIKSVI
ncbi:MAG: hypothetical protein ACFFKA_17115 [Candidatus Thorarchaeota archaeon]